MSVGSALHGVGSVIYGKYFVTLPIPTDTPELSKSTIIVTGANTGLGFEASKHLLNLRVGKLIMAVRDITKGEAAKKKLLPSTNQPESSVEVWPIDMNSYNSIEAFASRASKLPRLDGVLANAGLMTTQFALSEDNEKNINVNVISTFLLYLLLLPTMRESEKLTGNTSRFSIPNSALHYVAPLDELQPGNRSIMERLNNPETPHMAGRYNLSKLLVIYAVREFAERSKASGKGPCIINTPNPSFCKSNLAKESQGTAGYKVFESALARSTEEGSRALVHGLLAGPETNGQYLTNCKIQEPSCHVTGQWGQEVQHRFFGELIEKLETIHPGISANI
ncbi:NAD(P)-binding protein [Xylariaceae sp. AK1471]|nr:NAD(P)-binding protein [Xylariaceae sp. AK1471]